MPRIVGIKENLDQTLYSGWIADTRPGGLGISPQTIFRHPMHLFASDIGDRFRTNMQMTCTLPSDRTATIKRAGYHVSFSDSEDFSRFFETAGRGAQMEINIAGNSRHTIGLLGDIGPNGKTNIKPKYNYGIRIMNSLKTPEKIATRQSFFVRLWTSEEFAERMNRIESGATEGYAEIKSILDVTLTREVL